jgi:phosphoadenosine phosphosulfate reductase
MAHTLPAELEGRARATLAQLRAGLRDHQRVVYASSLGAEAMVLTDLIWSHLPEIDIVTIDTGRLPDETLALLDRVERHYGRRMRVVYPEATALERLTATHGVNGFYGSLEARLACCQIRKVEPFRRAIAGYGAWVTGLRRTQSAARAQAQPSEWDAAHGLVKLSPLLDWSDDDIWSYIRALGLPYNQLHDRGFASIGCAPCTRAVEKGADSRSGRWWWENPDSRECGLHPRAAPATARLA